MKTDWIQYNSPTYLLLLLMLGGFRYSKHILPYFTGILGAIYFLCLFGGHWQKLLQGVGNPDLQLRIVGGFLCVYFVAVFRDHCNCSAQNKQCRNKICRGGNSALKSTGLGKWKINLRYIYVRNRCGR